MFIVSRDLLKVGWVVIIASIVELSALVCGIPVDMGDSLKSGIFYCLDYFRASIPETVEFAISSKAIRPSLTLSSASSSSMSTLGSR